MIDTYAIRKKILDLAIQGMLSTQSPIERCSEYYELNGAFRIPSNWTWVEIDKITHNHGQKKPDTDFCYIDVGTLDNINHRLSKKENILDKDDAPSRARKIVEFGDVLYSTVRPYLHNICIVDQSFSHEPIASTAFAVLSPSKADLLSKYLLLVLMSDYFDKYANGGNSKGVLYPAISERDLLKGIIPLPPLEEQKRIVEKVDSIFTLLDEIDTNQRKFDLNFAKVRNKLINLAISGKLSQHNDNDTSIEKTLRESELEYELLVNSKKTKAIKIQSIGNYELFAVPDYWKWVSLSSICIFLSRGKSPKYSEEKKYPVFAQKCNQPNGLALDKALFLDTSTISKWPDYYKLKKDDIVINSTGKGTMGRVGQYNDYSIREKYEFMVPDSHVTVVRLSSKVNIHYVYLVMKSTFMNTILDSGSRGSTNQTELYIDTISSLPIPLPPIEEQNRIMAKLDEILPLLEA